MDIKSLLIQPERALPGRGTPILTSINHFVSNQKISPPFADHLNIADFGLGCFWGAERIFWSLEGVNATAVGYMGVLICRSHLGAGPQGTLEAQPSGI